VKLMRLAAFVLFLLAGLRFVDVISAWSERTAFGLVAFGLCALTVSLGPVPMPPQLRGR
jgi:hypothetical protein